METSDKFWFNDMGILFRKDRLTEFFPTLDMTLEEQMNSVVRFSIYSGVLLYLYNQNYLMLYLPIAGFALTKVIYDIRKPETENTDEKMGNERITEDNELDEELENNRTEIDGKECIKPTKNNPFMNPNHTDKMDDKPEACPTDNKDIREEMNEKFMHNLYQDVSDVFGRNNSSRQFYTIANTQNPNGQKDFAKWLYGTTGQCKSVDLNKCIHQDLRQKRPPVHLDLKSFEYDLS